MDAFIITIGFTSVAFVFGWIVGRDSQRRFNRRMSDINRRKRAIQWPVGHENNRS